MSSHNVGGMPAPSMAGVLYDSGAQLEAAFGGDAREREALGDGEPERLGDGQRPVDEVVAITQQRDADAIAGEALYGEGGFERGRATSRDEQVREVRHGCNLWRYATAAIRVPARSGLRVFHTHDPPFSRTADAAAAPSFAVCPPTS